MSFYTETYDMVTSSILLHYSTKTGFSTVLNELNMGEISFKHLRSYWTPVHIVDSIFYFLKLTFFAIHVDGFSSLICKVKKSVYRCFPDRKTLLRLTLSTRVTEENQRISLEHWLTLLRTMGV